MRTVTQKRPHERSAQLTQTFQRVTIAEVAARARCSTSTVSRALNGTLKGVGKEKAEEIRQLALDMGYQPNHSAAALRTGRSGVIGVLVPRLTDPVVATIYQGIDDEATALGYVTLVANTNDDEKLQRRSLDAFAQRRVEGYILADARLDVPILKELQSLHTPFILVSRTVPKARAITCDDHLGGVIAAQHLLAHGHRVVGVAAGEQYASTGKRRTVGFCETFLNAGHPIPRDYVIAGPFDIDAGRKAGEALLGMHPRPTAIFATNDFAAIGVMSALRDAGLTPGKDIAVIGYNDNPIAAHLTIPLTSIRSPMREMGATALRCILKLIAGESVASQTLKPELVVRESTSLWRS